VADVEPLSGLFDRLVREFAPAIAPDAGTKLEEIGAIWRRAVGEEIAAHARPSRFRGGVLTVEVDSAPLAAELGTFAREHLGKALEREGLVGLCELKFRTGGG
jgi:predicted nucleic acid-binding Zn ribbon protein